MGQDEPERSEEQQPPDDAVTYVGGGAAASSDGMPEVFGPYRVHGRLGEGGMSVVYEAVHAQRGRREALKVLHQRLEADPQIAERFHREVRAMSGLHAHDHVTPLFDSGEIDGRLYYTMPVLPGPTLHDLLLEIRALDEGLPGERANAVLDAYGLPDSPVEGEHAGIRYARRIAVALVGVADALAGMHAQEVLHRDVKPSNLMLDDNRRVVIADFGLVHLKDQRITGDEEWLGTPAYMAPEQIMPREDPLDGRADLYALGATLYELLTLRVPHRGDSVAETLTLAVTARATPVRTSNPTLPAEIETLVARCLEPAPGDRYPDAASLAADLAAFARGDEIRMKPVSLTRRGVSFAKRNWRLPTAVVAVLLLGAVWYWTRDATFSLHTVPEGVVRVDGERWGETPLVARTLTPGAHVIEVEPTGEHAKRFLPLSLPVDVARLEHRTVERLLRARDPGDPEALALLARSLEIRRADLPVEVASLRDPEAWTPLLPVWPRGKVRAAPDGITLEAQRPGVGDRTVRIRAADAPTPLVMLPVEEQTWGDGRILWVLDEQERARLVPGAYIVEVLGSDGEVEVSAPFSVMTADEVRLLEARIEQMTNRLEKDDWAGEILGAEIRLEAGVWQETFELAEALWAHGPLRETREVARVALAALAAAGIDEGPRFDWQDRLHGEDR